MFYDKVDLLLNVTIFTVEWVCRLVHRDWSIYNTTFGL